MIKRIYKSLGTGIIISSVIALVAYTLSTQNIDFIYKASVVFGYPFFFLFGIPFLELFPSIPDNLSHYLPGGDDLVIDLVFISAWIQATVVTAIVSYFFIFKKQSQQVRRNDGKSDSD